MRILINNFLNEATDLKDKTKDTYIKVLAYFGEFINWKKKFEKKDVLAYINSNTFNNMKIGSQNRYKSILRRFLKYLGMDNSYIKNKKNPKQKINPESLPTSEEIQILLDNMTNPCHKALLTLLLEGPRIDEARHIKIKDFVDKNTHGVIYIRESKSERRPVFIFKALPYIIEWLNNHPQKDNPEAYLFVCKYGGKIKQYSYSGIRGVIYQYNNIIPKYLHPHIFRHTSATLDLRAGIPKKQVMMKHGWSSWEMIERYAHLTDENVESKYMEHYGLKVPDLEDTADFIQNRKCYMCGFINPSSNKFCSQCGRIIAIVDLEELEKEKKSLQEKYSKKELVKLFSRWLDKQE